MVLQIDEEFALQVRDDDHGRYLILHIEIQEVPYVFINYYAPSDQCQLIKPQAIFREVIGTLFLISLLVP